MHKIHKGKLYQDGRAVFCLGQSFYPSFNPTKFPVPPEGDRIGEMQKDLSMMAQMGFNHVRFAALGEVSEDLQVRTPFIDTTTEEAAKKQYVRFHPPAGFFRKSVKFPRCGYGGLERQRTRL